MRAGLLFVGAGCLAAILTLVACLNRPVLSSSTKLEQTASTEPSAISVLLPLVQKMGTPVAVETRILVFSKTAGFRHDSIPAAVAAITQLGKEHGFAVDWTEEATQFTDANLARYRAVVFLMTTGDVLDDLQQSAFERYIRAGNGYVGVHSASDTEYTWPWYGQLVGAYFKDHPAIQRATINLDVTDHISMRGLPQPWVCTDEWYNFRENPRAQVTVLATLDEASYTGGAMGDHPIAWRHLFDGGRAWYTGAGHTAASYENAYFLRHILGGIQYAAGLASVPSQDDLGWEPLFKQRSDYYTYLPSSGVNNDPKGVFTFRSDGVLHFLDIPVTDAEQEFGYVATTKEYSRYRLRFQYKWGTKKFPPRVDLPRDSGVLFHLVGSDSIWPYSLELQVQENDTGDFFVLGPSITTTVRSLSDSTKQYQEGGAPFIVPFGGTRIIKSDTYDSLTDWNTVELVVNGDSATYIVNGNLVNGGSIFRQNGNAPAPLASGPILFQAEGAEVLYRNIEIKPIE
jgi:type 1 glutamine amidotransferase